MCTCAQYHAALLLLPGNIHESNAVWLGINQTATLRMVAELMKAVSKHGSSLLSIERTAVMLHPFLHAHPSASCPSPLLHVPPLSFMPCHFASCPAPQLHAPPLCFMPPISFMPHPLLHAPPLCFMLHPSASCPTHFLHAPPISYMPHPFPSCPILCFMPNPHTHH